MIIRDGAKVFVKNKKIGKFLFLLRDNKSGILYPNMYGLLGGGVEKGEDPLRAIERELKEETNINILNLEELGNRKVRHVYKEKGRELTVERKIYLFLAETDTPLEEARLYEGNKLEYFTLDEAKRLSNLIPIIREAVNDYEEQLKNF